MTMTDLLLESLDCLFEGLLGVMLLSYIFEVYYTFMPSSNLLTFT